MSGVIDEDGQQWEKCNDCGDYVEIESLHYERPSDTFPYGRDLCTKCATASPSPTQPAGPIRFVPGPNGSFSVAPEDRDRLDQIIDDTLTEAGLPTLQRLREDLKDQPEANG